MQTNQLDQQPYNIPESNNSFVPGATNRDYYVMKSVRVNFEQLPFKIQGSEQIIDDEDIIIKENLDVSFQNKIDIPKIKNIKNLFITSQVNEITKLFLQAPKVNYDEIKSNYNNKYLNLMRRFAQEASIVFKVQKFIFNLKKFSGFFRPEMFVNFQFRILNDKAIYTRGQNKFKIKRVNHHDDGYSLVPVLNPSNILITIQDTLSSIFILLCFFFLPIEQVVNQSFSELYGEFWNGFISLCIIFFVFDIIFYTNIGYYEQGICVKQRSKILRRYLSQFFLMDFLSLIPLLYIAINQYQQQDSYLFILFFLKLKKLYTIMSHFQEKIILKQALIYHSIMKLLNILTVILCVSHICSIILLSLSLNEQNWMKKYQQSLLQSEWYIQYLYAFYWSITTMATVGYGDITVSNPREVLVVTFMMIFSCFVYAFSFNTVGTIIAEIDQIDKGLRQKMRIVHQYFEEKNIDHELRSEVHKFLEYKFQFEGKNQSINEEFVLSQVTTGFRNKLIIDGNIQFLEKVKFLKDNFSHETLVKLAQKITSEQRLPKELVYGPSQNEFEDDQAYLYFIESGLIDIKFQFPGKKQNVLVKTIEKYDYFGEHNLFNRNSQNKFTYKVNRYGYNCILLKLTRGDFLETIKQNEKDYEVYCDIRDQSYFKINLIILVTNSQIYGVLKIKCLICNDIHHNVNECHKINYFADKEKIYIQNHYRIAQKRSKIIDRRLIRTGQPLIYLDLFKECCQELMQSIESPTKENLENDSFSSEIEIAQIQNDITNMESTEQSLQSPIKENKILPQKDDKKARMKSLIHIKLGNKPKNDRKLLVFGGLGGLINEIKFQRKNEKTIKQSSVLDFKSYMDPYNTDSTKNFFKSYNSSNEPLKDLTTDFPSYKSDQMQRFHFYHVQNNYDQVIGDIIKKRKLKYHDRSYHLYIKPIILNSEKQLKTNNNKSMSKQARFKQRDKTLSHEQIRYQKLQLLALKQKQKNKIKQKGKTFKNLLGKHLVSNIDLIKVTKNMYLPNNIHESDEDNENDSH